MTTHSIQITYRILSPEEMYGGQPPQFKNRPFPVSEIDAETTFHDESGQKLFEEPNFAIGYFHKLLEEWLKHPEEKDFVFKGEEIGWYCEIQFKIAGPEVTFIVLSDEKKTAKAHFSTDLFISDMLEFNTKLKSDLVKAYPRLSL